MKEGSPTLPHILIIDDEKNYLLVLEAMLSDAGYQVTTLNDPETAMAFIEDSEIDLILTDMKMPKITGRDILFFVKKNFAHIPVLVMTAFGSIESAVELMKEGAFDYITKPFSNDELMVSVKNAVALSMAQRRYQLLHDNLEERYSLHHIIGKSRAMQNVMTLVSRAAPSRSTVLITGESGTGKELVARAIHFASSRKDGPFISINCMSLNSGVLESELFGHEKGSFTGAVALRRGRFELGHGGTLFLDEIGELSLELQVKLLRVLQEKKFERVGGTEEIEVDIRIVAATNLDLLKEVEKGNFREDLYYRLNVVQIHLPPLRERREDIPLLVKYFIDKYSQENTSLAKSFTAAALDAITAYDWPGNIRQLENVVERCLVMASSDVVDLGDLPSELSDEEAKLRNVIDLLPVELDLAATLDLLEAALIRRALVRADFVQARAAEILGTSRSNFQHKLKKYGITGH